MQQAETVLYFTRCIRRFTRSMFEDMNWWGVIAMPIGVAICFGPVLIAWALAERRKETPQQDNRKERR